VNNDFPHPDATGRGNYKVQASLVSIVKEEDLDDERKRVVAKFVVREKKRAQYPWDTQPEPDNIYDADAKMGLYIYQKGRTSILFLDECIFKIERKRRYTRKPQHGAKILKLNLKKVELNEDHFKALQNIVSQHL
jgi:hypothetical protein